MLVERVYKTVLKPLLFRLPPESAHNILVSIGNFLGKTAFGKYTIRKLLGTHDKESITVGGVTLRGRVGLSAGFDYNGDLTQILPSVGFGFATIGTVTLGRYHGNPPPQLIRLPKSQSILVNKGLKNQGAAVIADKLSRLNFIIPIGVSIASTNKQYSTIEEQIQDILQCFQVFEASNVKHSYYELNISCPNLNPSCSGTFYKPQHLDNLLVALNKLAISRPVWIKMPISLSNQEFEDIMKVCITNGYKSFVIGNLQSDRTMSNQEEQVLIEGKKGNLSGAPTHARAVELVGFANTLYGKKIAIIGVGGIMTPNDALEFIQHGAKAVQLITGMIFTGPHVVNQINTSLTKNAASG